MILQGLKQMIQPLEVRYTNGLKKGGYVALFSICGQASSALIKKTCVR